MLMKRLVFFIVLLKVSLSFAFNISDLPSKFYIKNVAYLSVDVIANETVLAKLRPFKHRKGTFYFLDSTGEKLLILKVVALEHPEPELPLYKEVDVLDKNGEQVATLKFFIDNNFNLRNQFTMRTNITGTERKVYADNFKVIARLNRPLLTLSRDSTVSIMDKAAFKSKLDFDLLMASLAIYCINEDSNQKADADSLLRRDEYNSFLLKLQNIAINDHLMMKDPAIESSTVQMARDALFAQYQQNYHEEFLELDSEYNKKQKLAQLIEIFEDNIQGHMYSPTDEQAIIQYLVAQMGSWFQIS